MLPTGPAPAGLQAPAPQAPAVAAPQAPVPAAPSCPRCGGPGTWKPSANGWGCDRCQQMLPAPPGMGAMPPGPGAMPPGMAPQMPPQAQALAVKAAKRARAMRLMLVGGALCLIGIIITVATHDSAEKNGGGTYVIAYGPMIVGGIRFLQGSFGLMA